MGQNHTRSRRSIGLNLKEPRQTPIVDLTWFASVRIKEVDVKKRFFKFLAEEPGVTSIEYTVIAVILGIAVITSTRVIGLRLDAIFQSVLDAFP